MGPGALLEASWLLLPVLCPHVGLRGSSWGALGSLLESSGGPLEQSGEPLERAWSSPGSFLDPQRNVLRALGDLSAASEALLEPTERILQKPLVFSKDFMDFSGLQRSSRALGEALGGPLGALGALLGPLGAAWNS